MILWPIPDLLDKKLGEMGAQGEPLFGHLWESLTFVSVCSPLSKLHIPGLGLGIGQR